MIFQPEHREQIRTGEKTVTRRRWSICPETFPWGLDIRFRMLQPRELAVAMGFPESYEIVGNKTEMTKQIGNAVPVHLARALCEQVLSERDPTLLSFHSEPGATRADGGDEGE